MTNESAPVEQRDRDTAADIWRDYIARTGEIIVERNMRAGGLDDGLPALLAKHRIACTPTAVDGGLVEQVAKAICREIFSQSGSAPGYTGLNDDLTIDYLDVEETDMAKVARAALSAITPSIRAKALEDAWQPISTAPRDGTWVQIAKEGQYLGTARFDPHQPWTEFGEETTHWQPLPPPPRSLKGEQS